MLTPSETSPLRFCVVASGVCDPMHDCIMNALHIVRKSRAHSTSVELFEARLRELA